MWPVVVVGAGAAGLVAAIFAAEGGRPVLLLERTDRPGQKILIAGGGRCNVLPAQAHSGVFETDSPREALEAALAAWPLDQQTRFFEHTLGVRLKREDFPTVFTPPYPGVVMTSRFGGPGKLFPVSDQARQVRDALLDEARRRGVTLWTNASVEKIERLKTNDWRLKIEDWKLKPSHHPSSHLQSSNPQSSVFSHRLIIATGGLSVPTTGSDGTGLRLVEALGHAVTAPYPALTPLLGGGPAHHALAGVSLPVRLTTEGGLSRQAEGSFLFTHRGYSGPAVLDMSHAVTRPQPAPRPTLRVQWGEQSAEEWTAALVQARGGVLQVLRERLPERLARHLVAEAGLVETQRAAELRRADRQRLLDRLTRYPLPISGDEGYRKAEVTGGGVRLDQVHPATLESRVCPNLFLCGEILDVFGPIGGYNFLWAWASGYVAGRGASASDK
ncbi:MAG: aminoacetone oxidase family FAD-binding enzyme [Anaerolineae bacterium]|nr:aminoacetone oxidase family FAD-binding enzyme [Anaerolineae bacterium]